MSMYTETSSSAGKQAPILSLYHLLDPEVLANPYPLYQRLRTEDEKLLIELEKRYFGKLSFRADPAFHSEQFKIINAATNEEMASVGS